jgi:ComF family protein
MKPLLLKLTRAGLDLLFPMQCAGCRREGGILCAECTEGLARLSTPYCGLCASPNTFSPCRTCRESPLDVDAIRAPYLMEGAIKEAVHVFKYRGVRAAAPELGRLLAHYWAGHPMPVDIIVPVPLHPRRLRSRGYNQSALLGRELANLTGLALAGDLLARTKDATPQTGTASRGQRRSNVEGSFRCSQEVAGQKVLLVDDVATSGSTLSACAAALKAAGAGSVWGLTLAREG